MTGYRARLRPEQRAEALTRFFHGETQTAIALKMNIALSQVCHVTKRFRPIIPRAKPYHRNRPRTVQQTMGKH